MSVINIMVRRKKAADPVARIVCGNSDYKIAFNFDEEWAAHDEKTARFIWDGQYADVVFAGNVCDVPVITNTTMVAVGVYAGDLRTTTPALIHCDKSILCGDGLPADPTPDVYAQIMELLNNSGAGGHSPTATVNQTANGAVISITDKNGTTTATVTNGKDGLAGAAGKDGTSVTVASVSESTADGGSNVVTFSDGKKLNIKNGRNGIDATPVTPLFVNTIEECTDTTKPYVLPDGYIYAYVMKETVGGAGYTNLVPTSTDTDGSVYNGTGYKDNARLSSSGGVSSTAQTGSVVIGFSPCTIDDVIRIKGAKWIGNATGHYNFNLYSSSKTFLDGANTAENGHTPYDRTGSAFVYDDATGITTIDLAQTTWKTGGQTPAFFRINVYGKGADLIITVNEEIKEAGPTISYQWVNTGHTFVPADYEDRILSLEADTSKNTENITSLQEQVNDILDGTTEIAASTKFDPTVYGLPVLYLNGDTSPIAVSKDNKVTLNYTYGDRSGTCTLKGQGATSYKTAQALVNAGKKGKFNYTINFDQKFEVKEGWGSQKKYCLKANFIDTTHSRNICSCKLWGMSVKSRSVVPTELADLPNGGAIDGFPIVIMLNGEFHGLYTWNIPKDGWMFGLAEDITKTQAIVGADDHTAATQMKEASMTGFEVEFVSDEDNADWVETSLTRMISAVMNSDGSDLDTTVAQYLDLYSAIDHYIHTVVDKATDCVDKNYLLVTYDGVKWLMSEYDRDSIHGLNWDASGTTRPVSNVSFTECAEVVKIYELIKRFKTDALKARYKELRSNVLSESRIMQTFENFAWAIPSPVMVEDVKLYPTIKGSGVNTIDQIGRFVRQRLETCDAWIDAL